MNPLNCIKATIISVFILVFLFTSCTYDNGKCKTCNQGQPLSPGVAFHIVDKTSNEDLFFGEQSRFNLNQIKIHHIVDGKPDSALVRVDTEKHLFFVDLLYKNDVDTITMQIANLKPNVLYLNTQVSNPCCPVITISSASLDGINIFKSVAGTNSITIPL